MNLAFTIPGDPVAKGRPKLTTIGGMARAYTPAKTRNYEAIVRLAAKEAMAGLLPMDGPLHLWVRVYLGIPTSWSKRKKAAALEQLVLPTKKPDVDNVIKAVSDGMNAIAFTDDSRIVNLTAVKRYSDMPRVEVMVMAVDGEPA